jgi:hypothetical protein
MLMGNELSTELREYLMHCGLSDSKLDKCNAGTRLYHDLDIYGDIAEAYMEVLVDRYHVDMTGFEFDKFFPQEFAGKNALTRALLWIAPFAGNVARQRSEYQPLTLNRLDQVIHIKRWA